MADLVSTSHGAIAFESTAGTGPTVLFIHGNSSCKEVFRDQLRTLGDRYHCIAIDLPGHGQSEDAADPERTYNMTGYAGMALEVMKQLHDAPFFVVGWSLGGHIGIEMLSMTDQIKGLVITGTPPIGKVAEEMADAFLPDPHMRHTGQEVLSEEEAESYARTTCGTGRYESFLGDAVRRTDGRARSLMMAAAQRGDGIDQRHLVETNATPIAVINGRDEALVNNNYIEQIKFANLWRDQVFQIDSAGHAPFWDKPGEFNHLVESFLEDY